MVHKTYIAHIVFQVTVGEVWMTAQCDLLSVCFCNQMALLYLFTTFWSLLCASAVATLFREQAHTAFDSLPVLCFLFEH